MNSPELVWITWERHRRSREISRNLGATLHEFSSSSGRLHRYLRALLFTVRVFARSRGKVVIVQSPSIVLAWFATLCSGVFGFTLVIDAHNGGIEPLEGKYPILGKIARYTIRRASLTIVTTEDMASKVESLGARSFVLVDPIPAIESPGAAPDSAGRRTIVAISSWAADEPMEELIAAGGQLPDDVVMRITGRAKLSNEARQRLPSNVQLTGYLSEEAYIAMLGSADAIVDLTTREDCLVCGAYEALALARPLVVSDTTALRGLLQRAALYTRNFSSDIAAAARLALEQGVMLQREADARSLELREDWRSRKTQLLDHLARLNATR